MERFVQRIGPQVGLALTVALTSVVIGLRAAVTSFAALLWLRIRRQVLGTRDGDTLRRGPVSNVNAAWVRGHIAVRGLFGRCYRARRVAVSILAL